jgi:hypothetical protein
MFSPSRIIETFASSPAAVMERPFLKSFASNFPVAGSEPELAFLG